MRGSRFYAACASIVAGLIGPGVASADKVTITGRFFDAGSGCLKAPELLATDATWTDSRDPDFAMITVEAGGSPQHVEPDDLVVVVQAETDTGNGRVVPLAVTVKQGKRTVASRTWSLQVGMATTTSHAVMFDPPLCGAPMVITATLGKVKATRTVRFGAPCRR